MPLSNPSVAQIAQLISQVTASAFFLGSVAILISRMNRNLDRSQDLNAIKDDDQTKAQLKFSTAHPDVTWTDDGSRR
jgi:hypothetical protein